MRKLISYLFVFVASILLIGLSSSVGFAQTGDQPDPAVLNDPDVFTLAELGFTERFMVGPYDILDVFFSVPDHWDLTAGTYLQLELSYSVGGVGEGSLLSNPNLIGGSVLVRYNSEVITSVLLAGSPDKSIKINIPLEALTTPEDDGRHRLRFFLDASIHCDAEDRDLETVVWIEPDSYLKFVYNESAPTNDLSKFPKPYYQPDSIVPASVTLVVPGSPSSAELEAGLSISAGLGSVTSGESLVSLKQLGALTEADLLENNLIFIGMPDRFPDLLGINFPISIASGSLELASEVSDNGVIQSIVSPWNSFKSIMLVSGNSDEAVVKAAKAVSSGKLVVSGPANVTLVQNVTATAIQETAVVDQTLGDLGYTTSTLGIFGEVYYDIKFYASAEQARSEGAYIDIISTRSNLLDFNRSGVMLLLNDEVVGTLGFSEGDTKVVTERFELLPNFVRRGENRLEVITSLLPQDLCYTADLQDTWVTVSDLSFIHLPVSDRQFEIGERLDFAQYPLMFLGDPQFSDLAFVVAENDQAALDTAAQVAYALGNEEVLTLANFDVFYSGEVTDEVLSQKNLIFVGRATQLPILAEINDQLPAPFEEGSDAAIEPAMPVNYSVLPEVGLGYLQLLQSPWNENNALMLVMGNNDDGMLYAKDALTSPILVGELTGNYVSVYGDQMQTVDTRYGAGSPPVAPPENGGGTTEETPAPGETPAPTPPPTIARQKWLVPTILVTTGLMALLIIVFAVRGRSSRS